MQTAIGRYILRTLYSKKRPNIGKDVFGMHFNSPIGLAAGIDRDGELIDAMDAAGFGFVEIGSITPRKQGGTPHPYLIELKGDHALLHRAQIESEGVEQVIENIKRRNSRIVVGCNIAKGFTTAAEAAPRDYLRLFRPLYQYVDYFTVNICCNTTATPYIPTNREDIMAILSPLFDFRRGQNQYRPILLKISPDLNDEQIDMVTDIMLDTPLDGIVAVAGTTGRYGLENSTDKIHKLGRTPGTINGHPLKQRALEVVRRISERSAGAYPIIGCGGISTYQDVKDMFEAGASLVQICTEFIYNGGTAISTLNAALDADMRRRRATKKRKETITEATNTNNTKND